MTGDSKPQTRQGRPGPAVRRIAIGELLGSGREAVLVHDGIEYRLRLTSNGKLILTK